MIALYKFHMLQPRWLARSSRSAATEIAHGVATVRGLAIGRGLPGTAHALGEPTSLTSAWTFNAAHQSKGITQ